MHSVTTISMRSHSCSMFEGTLSKVGLTGRQKQNPCKGGGGGGNFDACPCGRLLPPAKKNTKRKGEKKKNQRNSHMCFSPWSLLLSKTWSLSSKPKGQTTISAVRLPILTHIQTSGRTLLEVCSQLKDSGNGNIKPLTLRLRSLPDNQEHMPCKRMHNPKNPRWSNMQTPQQPDVYKHISYIYIYIHIEMKHEKPLSRAFPFRLDIVRRAPQDRLLACELMDHPFLAE